MSAFPKPPARNGQPSPLPLTVPVRIAVVGLGYWGPNLVRNLHELPEAEVAYVCDGRAEPLEAIRRRYPAQPGDDARTTRCSNDPTVDAVAIATPVSTHFELAARALEAGKHVFVEKPLAGSSAEARELIDLALERDLVLMPGHTFLYSPPVDAIRRLISSGELGDIYFISTSRVNLGLHQPDVSVVWDLGPHDFSILRYWLDETPVTCDRAQPRLRDSVDPRRRLHQPRVPLRRDRSRRALVARAEQAAADDRRRLARRWSSTTTRAPSRCVSSTSGVDLPNPETFGEYRLTYRTGDIVSPQIAAAEPLYLEMSDFCKAIRTAEAPRSSAELGLEVVRIIESVDASLAADGSRVAVDDALPSLAS